MVPALVALADSLEGGAELEHERVVDLGIARVLTCEPHAVLVMEPLGRRLDDLAGRHHVVAGFDPPGDFIDDHPTLFPRPALDLEQAATDSERVGQREGDQVVRPAALRPLLALAGAPRREREAGLRLVPAPRLCRLHQPPADWSAKAGKGRSSRS